VCGAGGGGGGGPPPPPPPPPPLQYERARLVGDELEHTYFAKEGSDSSSRRGELV
jgi:hypothetical protein